MTEALVVVEAVEIDLPATDREPLDLEKAEILADGRFEVKTPEDFHKADTWRARWDAHRKVAWPIWERWTNVLFKRHQQACLQRSVYFAEGDLRSKYLFEQMVIVRAAEARRVREEELKRTEQAQAEARANQLREAKVLEKAGHKDMAAAVREAPLPPPAPVTVPSRIPLKSGGRSGGGGGSFTRFREVWVGGPATFHGDPEQNPDGYRAALKAAAKVLPREYLVPDEKMLAELATRSQGTVKVGGWKFWKQTQR